MLDADDPESPDQDLKLRQFLTYRLVRLQSRLNVQASRYLAEHAGITLTDWRIIAMIDSLDNTTLTYLNRETGLDKGQLSRKLRSLTSRGLVSSQQDNQDSRVQHLTLTAEGKSIVDAMLPRMRARQRFLTGTLTEDELSALHRSIDKLERAAETTEFET